MQIKCFRSITSRHQSVLLQIIQAHEVQPASVHVWLPHVRCHIMCDFNKAAVETIMFHFQKKKKRSPIFALFLWAREIS